MNFKSKLQARLVLDLLNTVKAPKLRLNWHGILNRFEFLITVLFLIRLRSITLFQIALCWFTSRIFIQKKIESLHSRPRPLLARDHVRNISLHWNMWSFLLKVGKRSLFRRLHLKNYCNSIFLSTANFRSRFAKCSNKPRHVGFSCKMIYYS